MYAMIMVCHSPSIYPSHVSIYIPYIWIIVNVNPGFINPKRLWKIGGYHFSSHGYHYLRGKHHNSSTRVYASGVDIIWIIPENSRSEAPVTLSMENSLQVEFPDVKSYDMNNPDGNICGCHCVFHCKSTKASKHYNDLKPFQSNDELYITSALFSEEKSNLKIWDKTGFRPFSQKNPPQPSHHSQPPARQVRSPYGHVFERSNLVKALEKRSGRCPLQLAGGKGEDVRTTRIWPWDSDHDISWLIYGNWFVSRF